MYPAKFGIQLYLSDLTISHKCFVWMSNLFLLPLDGNFFTFTRHEPIGVCGQIIPVSWRHLFQTQMCLWKMEILLKFCLCKCIYETLPIRNLQILKDRGYPRYSSNSATWSFWWVSLVQPHLSCPCLWMENKSQNIDWWISFKERIVFCWNWKN